MPEALYSARKREPLVVPAEGIHFMRGLFFLSAAPAAVARRWRTVWGAFSSCKVKRL